MKKQQVSWVIFGSLVVGAALLGTRATQNGKGKWYIGLNKPVFQPPRVVFPVAWTALYGMIALAGSRVWMTPSSPDRTKALVSWGAQLGFNVAWSELFFRHHRPRLALADTALLFASIGAFYVSAGKVDRLASRLFVPYLGWVAFAAVLNEEIVRLNPGVNGSVPRIQVDSHDEDRRILARA